MSQNLDQIRTADTFQFCSADQSGFPAAENDFKNSEYVRQIKDRVVVDVVVNSNKCSYCRNTLNYNN